MDQPPPPAPSPKSEVVVTDVRMPFGSMVVFLIKWSLASIPALVVLFLVGALLSGVAVGTFRSLASIANRPERSAAEDLPATGTTGDQTYFPRARATGAPITGKTVEVRMVGDADGYRFVPANITVHPDDGIKFIMVSGGPHNVAMDPAEIPVDVRAQLSVNMPNQMADLVGPLLINPSETYTISLGNVKPGRYSYHCTPHLAMGMQGTITVR